MNLRSNQETEKPKLPRRHSRRTTSEVQQTETGMLLQVNDYVILAELGKGSFGNVYKVERKAYGLGSSKIFAMKTVSAGVTKKLKRLSRAGEKGNEDRDVFLREIALMKKMNHPNLIHLEEVIEAEESMRPKCYYIVMEFIIDGPIMHTVKNSDPPKFASRLSATGVFGEAKASTIMRELLSALSYLHRNKIAHRDLKPENMLMAGDGSLRLADFGVSKSFENISCGNLGYVTDTQGTWAFWSPEMCGDDIATPYSAYLADVWAAGICLWIFIFGELPFYKPDPEELFEVIYTAELPPLPSNKSPELQQLLFAMLSKEVSTRPSSEQCEKFDWIQQHSTAAKEEALSAYLPSIDLSDDKTLDVLHALTPGSVISAKARNRLLARIASVRDQIRERKEKHEADRRRRATQGADARRQSVSFDAFATFRSKDDIENSSIDGTHELSKDLSAKTLGASMATILEAEPVVGKQSMPPTEQMPTRSSSWRCVWNCVVC